MQPLHFIHANEGGGGAPLKVGVPHVINVAAITRLYGGKVHGQTYVMVETAEHAQPFSDTLENVARCVRVPLARLCDRDNLVQFINPLNVAVIYESRQGIDEAGLISGARIELNNTQELLGKVSSLVPLVEIKQHYGAGHGPLWHVAPAHVLGLTNGAVILRGGFEAKTREPMHALLEQFAQN